ncbi:MAG: sugar transferase [Rhodopirellula sp.]|nr:sugar transferase [Rhodopirellula sp.]
MATTMDSSPTLIRPYGGASPALVRQRTRTGQEQSNYFRWKSLVDRGLAAALLIPCLPIIGILVLLVRLTSRGPGMYRQARVGKDGRVFLLYKIRTMAVDAESRTGAVWSGRDDPRVTPLGRLLRRTHLDEFPQLLNVLKGEMSLVGPRPERPEFVDILSGEISRYSERLTVPPGITGLAQLNLPPDSDTNDVRRKLLLDLEYLQEAGWFLDLRILLATSGRVLKLSTVGILGLSRQVPAVVDDELLSVGKTTHMVNSGHVAKNIRFPSIALQRPAPVAGQMRGE